MNEKLPNVVSVIGCPRSGTTLMQAQLARHFDLSAISETHYIFLFSKYLWLWRNLKDKKNRLGLIKALQDFTKIRWGIISGYNLEKVRQISILESIEKVEQLADGSGDYKNLINDIYRVHAKIKGSAGVIEKFSYYSPVDIEFLSTLLPETKFIHVIRDGRDVSLSWRKTWFGPKSVLKSALLWQKHVTLYADWGRRNPSRYLEINFSDIIENEYEVLDEISKFIRMPLQESSFKNNNVFAVLAEKEHYKKSKSSPDKEFQLKWPLEMEEKHKKLFMKVAGRSLTKYGFEDLMLKDDKQTIFVFAWEILKEIKEFFFGKITWKRRAFSIFPLVIKISQILNISLYQTLSLKKKNNR
ncbi:sulfotransferase [Desulforhopalus vacuolatus]|uniref:sulfotransferase family protein n=1 Tax=Desulforhopalus vacuolatus TaxID=40414 RepID=UPI001963B78D|nr:sulfotransferase [Desulforhopalus vacuolatus]MBM9520780.1 sulfotransferase [Desulforhopalus vacuolatus]